MAEEESDSKDDSGKHQQGQRSQTRGVAGPVQKESSPNNQQEIQPFSTRHLTDRQSDCPVSRNISEETDLTVQNNCKFFSSCLVGQRNGLNV